MDSQTIVAPMTPAGVSAVAALRVSGTRVRDVVSSLFGERAAKSLEPRRASLGTARDPKSGKLIDSLLFLFFEGPNSYTGEDVLELYPHGNPLIVRELLQAIRALDGVRLAEPGEFTRRAFLNGKMDLAQAESVADVIHSANRAATRILRVGRRDLSLSVNPYRKFLKVSTTRLRSESSRSRFSTAPRMRASRAL